MDTIEKLLRERDATIYVGLRALMYEDQYVCMISTLDTVRWSTVFTTPDLHKAYNWLIKGEKDAG